MPVNIMGMNLGDVQKYLQGINFPTDKGGLLSGLQSNGAPQQILDAVRGSDRNQFHSADDVMSAAQGR